MKQHIQSEVLAIQKRQALIIPRVPVGRVSHNNGTFHSSSMKACSCPDIQQHLFYTREDRIVVDGDLTDNFNHGWPVIESGRKGVAYR